MAKMATVRFRVNGDVDLEVSLRVRQQPRWLRIPTHRGHLLRFDRGQATDLMAATIPI